MSKKPNEIWEETCITAFKEMLDNTYPLKVGRNKELIAIIMNSTSTYMQNILDDLTPKQQIPNEVKQE